MESVACLKLEQGLGISVSFKVVVVISDGGDSDWLSWRLFVVGKVHKN